jgi:hypothetical protein
MDRQELETRGDEVRLTTTYLTDPYERVNYEQKKAAGKGFIRNSRGKVVARHILQIPQCDAAMLRAKKDPDWLEFEATNDPKALRRLIIQYPWWVVAEGGI